MTKKHTVFEAEEPTEPKYETVVFTPPVERCTPEAWCKRLGHFRRADPRLPQQEDHADQMHAAADQLHGWSQHAYHHQAEPFEISQADYEAALEAGQQFPLLPPHGGALPESQRARFADFVPARACVRSKETR